MNIEKGYLLARLDQAGGDDKLEDAEEDEEDAGHHPHVQEGDIGDLWHILSHSTGQNIECTKKGEIVTQAHQKSAAAH